MGTKNAAKEEINLVPVIASPFPHTRYTPRPSHSSRFCHPNNIGSWRIKNNDELDKLIKHENIVSYIKAQILSWFGHLQRMLEARSAKKIFKWNPLTTRPTGRLKNRWEDNIIQDLGQMKIKNWITYV